jgi:cytochrome c556
MKKIIAAAALLAAFGATVAFAGPIEDRQALMKQMAGAAKASAAIVKAPAFNAAAAKAQMQTLADDAGKIGGLFPAGSEKGDVKTTAGPAIWTDPAGFKAAAAKLETDAKAGQSAADTAGFATAFKTVQADCGGCHKAYRVK